VDHPRTPLRQRVGRSQRTALIGAVLIALGLAGYGAVGSYQTITALAAKAGLPLPNLVPIGIDGGLVGVVVLDLILAWTGDPVGWLRHLARLLTVGTVAANISAGWPAPIAIGLHAAAPLMLLAMVEAGRTVLLRRAGLAAGTLRDRIPVTRWILAPWRTCVLWRRMVLWQLTNYPDALATEARLQRARILLRTQYGRRWRHTAPPELVWMLDAAPFTDEACTRVDNLTSGPPRIASKGQPELLNAAVTINERHWVDHGRPVSAETVRRELRVGSRTARQLTRAVRARDLTSVEGASRRAWPEEATSEPARNELGCHP